MMTPPLLPTGPTEPGPRGPALNRPRAGLTSPLRATPSVLTQSVDDPQPIRLKATAEAGSENRKSQSRAKTGSVTSRKRLI